MLYKKNKEELLDEELFRNPTKEYRGAPFWSWNCKLDEGLLKRQIEYFKEMGFGGYIMHPRYGLDTEYLSDEFMDFISFCINEGKRNDMLSWLYDEDRWPSGFAGGIVTKVPKYRQRGLYITKDKSKLPVFETNRTKALDEGLAYFLACFDVQFDDNGNMISYNVIEEKSAAEYEKYYAYSMANPLTDGYNNFTYADIMQPDAMKRFIEVTHNEYYKRFGKEYDINIPGIDLLYDNIEFLTSKQAQSIVHQYNKEGMLCELYGVTGWDFDFKCLKMQGDYLAALGVTIRVPHLSMLSMEGRSKRDYPASFNYQSPWYEEFKYLEDHFARLATILTRGEPVVKVAMLHPIETSMMSIGTHEKTDSILEEQDAMLQNIMSSVIYANIDFDFLCEALLSEQVVNVSDVLSVGAMEYNAVVIPPIKTIRSTTIDILGKFISNGGKVIFMGDCPMYCNGRKSDKAISVYNKSIKVGFDMAKLIKSLEDERDITISGTEKLVYQLRKDNSCYWLFIARAEKLNKDSAQRKEAAPKKIIVTVNDEFDVFLCDGDVKIKNPGKEIEFGAVTKQGMPFYGGNIIYTVEGETGSGSAKIKVEDFGAHCIRVMIDDENADLIALAPFCIEKELCAGKHKFEFICYGNRNNTFGPVHNCKNICGDYYISPRAWEKSCEYWNDKYFLQNTGILSSPLVEMRSAEEKH